MSAQLPSGLQPQPRVLGTDRRAVPPVAPRSGYSLMELLIVMSIIAILSGLILTILPGTKAQKTRKAVTAQMHMLELAIENFHARMGFYPPWTNAPERNPLYYELVGLKRNGTDFSVGQSGDFISAGSVQAAFGSGFSFLNIATVGSNDPNDPDKGTYARTFHANIKPSHVKTNGQGVYFLIAPGEGHGANRDERDFNPWRYRSPGTNNVESFDLWAEVLINDKIETIGNWRH